MVYTFEWDPKKAAGNHKKHGVRFEDAATVFNDPRALSVYDDEHSAREDRWITLGVSMLAGLLAVHHTFEQVDESLVLIRIISTRKATKREIQEYTR